MSSCFDASVAGTLPRSNGEDARAALGRAMFALYCASSALACGLPIWRRNFDPLKHPGARRRTWMTVGCAAVGSGALLQPVWLLAIFGDDSVPCAVLLWCTFLFPGALGLPLLSSVLHFIGKCIKQNSLAKQSQSAWAAPSTSVEVPEGRLAMGLGYGQLASVGPLAVGTGFVILVAAYLGKDERLEGLDEHCGCLPVASDLPVLAAMWFVVLLLAVVAAEKTRGAPDVAGLRSEQAATAVLCGGAVLLYWVLEVVFRLVMDEESLLPYVALQLASCAAMVVNGIWPALLSLRMQQHDRNMVQPLSVVAGAGATTAVGSATTTHRHLLQPTCLRDTLHDAASRRAFQSHLRREFTLENLVFYDLAGKYERLLHVEKFGSMSQRSVSSSDISDMHSQRLEELRHFKPSKLETYPQELARRMIDAFVKPGAPHEVNLSSRLRRAILSADLSDGAPPDPQLFSVARGEIYNLMERDAFWRFQKQQQQQRELQQHDRSLASMSVLDQMEESVGGSSTSS